MFAGEDGEPYARLSDQPDNMNAALVLQMNIESWIGGNLKFLMMATGREGAEGSWCFYCELMASEWKKHMSAAGKEWTKESLQDFHDSIKDTFDQLKSKQLERKGHHKDHVLLFPVIVDIDHFVMPVLHILHILHILLGYGNCIYDDLIAELQGGYEVFSDKYVELEKALRGKELEFAQAKEDRRRHEQYCGNYIKYLNVSIRYWV